MSYSIITGILILIILYILYNNKKVIEGFTLEELYSKNLNNITYLSNNIKILDKSYTEGFYKYNISARIDAIEKKITRINEILTKDIPTKITNIREKTGLGKDLNDKDRLTAPKGVMKSDADIRAEGKDKYS